MSEQSERTAKEHEAEWTVNIDAKKMVQDQNKDK